MACRTEVAEEGIADGVRRCARGRDEERIGLGHGENARVCHARNLIRPSAVAQVGRGLEPFAEGLPHAAVDAVSFQGRDEVRAQHGRLKVGASRDEIRRRLRGAACIRTDGEARHKGSGRSVKRENIAW